MKIKKMKHKFLGILVVGFLAYFFGISIVKGAGNCNPFYNNYAGCLYGCRSCRDDCAFCMAEPGQDCTDDCDCDDACDCERFLNAFCSCIQDGGVSSFGYGLCGNNNSNGDEGTEGENGDGDEGEGDEGEGDDNCDDWGENYYYDPNIQTCIQCEKPLIDDSCESYGGNWFLNDLRTCCEMDCSSSEEATACNDEEGKRWDETKCKCVCDSSVKCCGIQLNTVVPFIGDCIEMNTDSSRGDTTSVNSVTAFPILMQGLMKILMSVIMIFSFLMVIASGLMMTTGAFSSGNFDKGKTILKNVLISLILLGSSGLILSLINPSFFGG